MNLHKKKDREEMIIQYIKLYIYYIFNPVLVSLVIKVLTWEPPGQKPNPVKKEVAKRITIPQSIQVTQKNLSPIKITDLKTSVDYGLILKQHEETGKPIKPIKHRKPISKDITCPKCGAPYTYI